MKNSLLSSGLAVAILFIILDYNLNGQTVIFNENFSGFTSGSHSSPATTDVSGVLDLRTQLPGWTGNKIYSAGGQVKIGTADISGWIETPLIDFLDYEDTVFLKFDISRWPGITTSVQVSINGILIGSPISPSDEFNTLTMSIPLGTLSGKLKFESLNKRFYLDNIEVFTGNLTSINKQKFNYKAIKIYPNPSVNFLTIELPDGMHNRYMITVSDPAGRIVLEQTVSGEPLIIDVSGLGTGFYILSVSDGNSSMSDRLIILR
jgi:hypothetical protein